MRRRWGRGRLVVDGGVSLTGSGLILKNRRFASHFVLNSKGFSLSLMGTYVRGTSTRVVALTLHHTGSKKLTGVLSCVPSGIALLPGASNTEGTSRTMEVTHLSHRLNYKSFMGVRVVHSDGCLLPSGFRAVGTARVLTGRNFVMVPCVCPSLGITESLTGTNTTYVVPLNTPVNSGGNVYAGRFVRVLVSRVSLPVVISTNVNHPSRTYRTVRVNTTTIVTGATITATNSIRVVTRTFGGTVRTKEVTCLSKLKHALAGKTDTSSPLAKCLHSWSVVWWLTFRKGAW